MQDNGHGAGAGSAARGAASGLLSLLLMAAGNAPAQVHETLWVPAHALMAGTRGFYPNAAAYAGTGPLGAAAAMGCGILTWVADVPVGGTYSVWVRRYMGYGSVGIRIDEGGELSYNAALRRNSLASNQYGWEEVGRPVIAPGIHHIDIQAHRPGTAMLDAVLLTTDPAFVPALDGANLPAGITNPVLRASRNRYRDDSGLAVLAGARGFVAAALPALYGEPFDMPLNDFVPAPDQVIETLRLWSARNQYATATFAVRALTEADVFQAAVGPLTGPGGATIGLADLDLKVVKPIDRTLILNWVSSAAPQPLPDLLLRDDRTSIPPTGHQGGFGGGACVCSLPAHESRQFWLTVHVPPSAMPGSYTGTVALAAAGAPGRVLALPVELQVEPIRLPPADGLYGIYQPFGSAVLGTNRLLEVLHDQVRHGINSATLYGGYNDLNFARQAGMTGYAIQMSWPGGSTATSRVAEARALGFKDYLFYIKDEPSTQTAIDQAISGLDSAHRLGVKGVVTLNNTNAWIQLRDRVDVPIHVLYHFHGADNAAAAAAAARGFLPVSYWVANISDPLYYRAYAGLYNARCGYRGCSPWAYADFPDDRCYSNTQCHVLSYADANGLPVSTIRWEAHKDGIDDVRYLQELDRLLAAARARQEQPEPPRALADAIARAASVRAAEYEAIGGSYFDYLNQLPATRLDATRLALAGAILGLNAPMAIDGTLTVDEGETVAGLLRGLDLDGDALAFRIVTNGVRGTAVITDPSTGAFTYAAGGAPGTDTVTFQCSSEGVASASATVAVTIRDQPVTWIVDPMQPLTNASVYLVRMLRPMKPFLPALRYRLSVVAESVDGAKIGAIYFGFDGSTSWTIETHGTETRNLMWNRSLTGTPTLLQSPVFGIQDPQQTQRGAIYLYRSNKQGTLIIRQCRLDYERPRTLLLVR